MLLVSYRISLLQGDRMTFDRGAHLFRFGKLDLMGLVMGGENIWYSVGATCGRPSKNVSRSAFFRTCTFVFVNKIQKN